jgi:hypothetical protein
MNVSPVVRASKQDKQLTQAEFNSMVDLMRDSIKAIIALDNERTKRGPNHKLDIKGHKIGKKDINNFWKALLYQMNSLKKFYANRKKNKSNRGPNNQLKTLHYVSDQWITFIEGADLGLVDPSDSDSAQLSDAISLITEKHMANAGILTSLLSRYIRHNELKRQVEGEASRYVPDSRMKSALSTSELRFFGEKIADRGYPETLDEQKVSKIEESIKFGKKSAFARISERVSGKDEETSVPVYDKKKGLLFTSMMMFNSLYRIPPELNTQEERDALVDEENVQMAAELSSILKNITRYYHDQDKKKKKNILDA